MDIDHLVRTPGLEGTQWSVAVVGPDHEWCSPYADLAGDRLLKTASVAKVFLLIETERALADGRLVANEVLNRSSTTPVADSGIWQHLVCDSLPVEDVATLVGTVSDNWATNVLLDRLGLQVVQERAREWASRGSTLCDYVRTERDSSMPDTLSRGCALDWVDVMQRLWAPPEGEATGTKVLNWMSNAADLSMVASATGLDPLCHSSTDRGIRVWSKTGTDEGVRADIGVLEVDGHPWFYAAICNWREEDTSTRDSVLGAMRELGTSILAEARDAVERRT